MDTLLIHFQRSTSLYVVKYWHKLHLESTMRSMLLVYIKGWMLKGFHLLLWSISFRTFLRLSLDLYFHLNRLRDNLVTLATFYRQALDHLNFFLLYKLAHITLVPDNRVFTICVFLFADELFRIHKLKPTTQWRQRFDNYIKTMPGYYAQVRLMFIVSLLFFSLLRSSIYSLVQCKNNNSCRKIRANMCSN